MTVAGGEECPVDRDREEERRPGDELLAIDVPAPAPRRNRRVDAGFGRRHADDPEERGEVELAPQRPADAVRELPVHRVVVDGDRDPPRADLDLVDADGERLARARSADRDRPRKRVAPVELGVRRLESLAGRQVPAGIRHREANGVARLDLEHRLELLREVAVEVRGLERKLVEGH